VRRFESRVNRNRSATWTLCGILPHLPAIPWLTTRGARRGERAEQLAQRHPLGCGDGTAPIT